MKIFSLFLLCAALAWFISKLSEQYNSTTRFNLVYTNVPDSLLFKESSKKQLEVKLLTSGFQFLRFNFNRKEVMIDLSKVKKEGNSYYLSQEECRDQIARQLSGSITLLEIEDRDPLYFDLYRKHFKTVPVVPNIGLEFVQNYILEGKMAISPSEVILSGPKNEIDSIDGVRTVKTVVKKIAADFSVEVDLIKSDKLKNTQYSTYKVLLSGKVSKFSEKILEVPVEVINLPKDWDIKVFPNKVSLLCKAKIDILKGLDSSDFRIIADFSKVKDSGDPILPLELKKKPQDMYNVKLIEQEVEYILKRQ